jgi:ATP-binding cassette subfamily C protein
MFFPNRQPLSKPESKGEIATRIPSSDSEAPHKMSFGSLLYGLLKGYRQELAVILCCSLGILALNLAFAAFTHFFVDRMLVEHHTEWGYALLTAVGCSLLILGILVYLQNRMFMLLGSKMALQISSNAFWHLLNLPFNYFNRYFSSEIAYQLSGVEKIVDAVTGNLAIAVVNCGLIIIYAIAIAYYSPWLAVTFTLMIGIYLSILWGYSIAIRKMAAHAQNLQEITTKFSLAQLENIETISIMGMEKHAFSSWANYAARSANAEAAIAKREVMFEILPSNLLGLALAVLFGIAGKEVYNGTISPGMFAALFILSTNMMIPVIYLAYFTPAIHEIKSHLTFINDLCHQQIDPLLEQMEKQATTIQHLPYGYQKLAGDVVIRNITFGYDRDEPPVLRDISLHLHPGKSVAIVGHAGVGKTTLLHIVAGLLKPWRGSVLYDGVPRETLSIQCITSSLAFVEKEPFLFEGTLRENLTLYDGQIPQHELDNAIRKACIYDEMMRRKGGYEQEIWHNGANLSSGQCQRLEIARGLLKRPTILLLDECSSTLDAFLEEQVMNNILRCGSALLIVAHRLNSIVNCDEIHVLHEGQFVASGTHAELKEHSAAYQELLRIE